MTASVRILTIASLDSNPSLLVVSPDGSKTLVNCGEGCQRSFLESAAAVRISSVNRVCLTHLGHDAVGGLPGMILTSADVLDSVARELRHATKGNRDRPLMANGISDDKRRGNRGDNGRSPTATDNNGNHRKRKESLVSKNDDEDEMLDLEIVGPEGTAAFLHSLRHFMRRDRFKVHAHEDRYDSSLNNNKASASFAAKKKGKKKKKKAKGGADTDEIGFNVRSVPISYDSCDSSASDVADEPSIRSLPMQKQAVTYLFTTPPIPGKFLIDKAQALNVPRGPLYAQLKAGKNVAFVDATTGEERTVTSEEVVAKSSPGVGVAVVYCPALAVLSKLQEADAFQAFANSPRPESDNSSEDRVELNVMVHMTPRSIFQSPMYQCWCRSFGTHVDHITLHSVETLNDCVALEENSPYVSATCGGIRRSLVHDGVFPCALPKISDDNNAQTGSGVSDFPTINSCSLMDYVLMPRSRCGLDKSSVKSLYSTSQINRLREKVYESGAIQLAKAMIDSDEDKIHSGSGLGELIFTGTGSAVPCKHRNVTGMYLRMNNGNSILLDVGEGTVGQLLRSWKSLLSSPNQQSQTEDYRTRLKGIKAVWISHPHADHHLGLLRLLSERTAVCGSNNDPLMLMAPPAMFDFLREYGSVVPEIKQSYIPINCYDMIHGRVHPLGNKLYEELGITYCASIPVAHCPHSYAVVIDGTSFGRVAYSGDCRPSNRFADVARGADLLIHEATFENGMEADAVMKRHSTVGEAIDIAAKMNAASLVLTHFSQRYPKIPPLNQSKHEGKAKEIPVTFAFDFMRLTPQTIDLSAKLTSALRLLYSQEEELDESDEIIEKVAAKEILAVPGVFATKGVL